MNNKQLTINNIKMDLHRVCSYVGKLENEIREESVLEFLNHALSEFERVDLSEREKELHKELKGLKSILSENTKDPHKRLRWAEKVMTVRCRL